MPEIIAVYDTANIGQLFDPLHKAQSVLLCSCRCHSKDLPSNSEHILPLLTAAILCSNSLIHSNLLLGPQKCIYLLVQENRKYVYNVAVCQKYQTWLGEMIIFSPRLQNYNFSKPSKIFLIYDNTMYASYLSFSV